MHALKRDAVDKAKPKRERLRTHLQPAPASKRGNPGEPLAAASGPRVPANEVPGLAGTRRNSAADARRGAAGGSLYLFR